jgi:hypothetical protein
MDEIDKIIARFKQVGRIDLLAELADFMICWCDQYREDGDGTDEFFEEMTEALPYIRDAETLAEHPIGWAASGVGDVYSNADQLLELIHEDLCPIMIDDLGEYADKLARTKLHAPA